MFVCYGSQVKHGEETFRKVDKTYPLLCADIANQFKIPYYSIVSSGGGDPSSMFLYMKVKGEVERDLKEKKLNYLTILKPGLIKNRPDARTGEKIAQFFSFLPFPSIECVDIGRVMMMHAEEKLKDSSNEKESLAVLENQDMLNYLKEKK